MKTHSAHNWMKFHSANIWSWNALSVCNKNKIADNNEYYIFPFVYLPTVLTSEDIKRKILIQSYTYTRISFRIPCLHSEPKFMQIYSVSYFTLKQINHPLNTTHKARNKALPNTFMLPISESALSYISYVFRYLLPSSSEICT